MKSSNPIAIAAWAPYTKRWSIETQNHQLKFKTHSLSFQVLQAEVHKLIMKNKNHFRSVWYPNSCKMHSTKAHGARLTWSIHLTVWKFNASELFTCLLEANKTKTSQKCYHAMWAPMFTSLGNLNKNWRFPMESLEYTRKVYAITFMQKPNYWIYRIENFNS